MNDIPINTLGTSEPSTPVWIAIQSDMRQMRHKCLQGEYSQSDAKTRQQDSTHSDVPIGNRAELDIMRLPILQVPANEENKLSNIRNCQKPQQRRYRRCCVMQCKRSILRRHD